MRGRTLEVGSSCGVQLRKLSDDVLARLREVSVEMLAEAAQRDPLTERVYDSCMTFYKSAREHHALSEQAYLNTR
jgi:TRAP-type mannitol/chloroaromatic compound transport system substrate-binding protein